MQIITVILAAGMGSRAKDIKILLPILGKLILQHVLDLACQLCYFEYILSVENRIILVLGHRYQDISTYLNFIPETNLIDVIVNHSYKNGMSSSLQAGLSVMPIETKGMLVMLADMPFITPIVIQHIIKAFLDRDTDCIIVPTYHGQQGHPILFGADYFAQLSKLQGDIGGRMILSQYKNYIHYVPVDCHGILLDIDTFEQWQSYQK